MIELINEVDELAARELKRANEEYRLFASPHEGYAILREEVDEAFAEVKRIAAYTECPWEAIKHDDTDESVERIERLAKYMTLACAEFIQAIAMCKKYVASAAKDWDLNNVKPMFNIERYKGDYVMVCANEKERAKFHRYLDSKNKTWISGRRYDIDGDIPFTDDDIGEAIYFFNEGVWDRSFALETDGEEYTVLHFNDFEWED